MIAHKVRKCPLSPFVTSNVILSCLVRMADILARLAQKADSLSALQLTGARWYSLSNTPLPPHSSLPPVSPPPHFLDRSAAPGRGSVGHCTAMLHRRSIAHASQQRVLVKHNAVFLNTSRKSKLCFVYANTEASVGRKRWQGQFKNYSCWGSSVKVAEKLTEKWILQMQNKCVNEPRVACSFKVQLIHQIS